MTGKSYILLTPARNEESFLAKTIQSVITQTVLPKKWIIISDGSTDKTDQIATQFAELHDFISVKRIDRQGDRNFGSKAHAIMHGLTSDLTGYDFIGILDADVTLEPEHFDTLMNNFLANQRLGIAGGQVWEYYNNKFFPVVGQGRDVYGANQFFKRECYEQIGGYRESTFGGIDTIAVIMARMHGWETVTYKTLRVIHHRRMGTAERLIVVARFREGLRDYMIGYHPLYQFGKCVRRISDPPFILGSVSRYIGFIWGAIANHGTARQLPHDFIRYLRSEQVRRMQSFLMRN